MSPDAGYVIGAENGADTKGNAPFSTYAFWPLEIAIILIVIPTKLYPPLEFNMTGIASAVIVLFLLVFSVLTIFQLILRVKFRNLHTHTELELLLDRARNRMGYSQIPEVWIYPSLKPILVPLSGFPLKSILISDSAVDDLLASPEHGEVILADTLTSLQDRTLSTWLPIFMFILISLFIYPWIGLTTQMKSTIFLFMFWTIAFLMVLSIVRPKNESKDAVLEEYNIHSNFARCIVFRKEQPTESEIADILTPPSMPIHSLNKIENGTAFIIALVVSQIVWILAQNFALTLGFNNIGFFPDLHIVLPFLVAINVFFVLDYYLGKMIQRRKSDDMTISTPHQIQ